MFLRQRFGEKVVRVPVSLHQPCPNRIDGKPGCLFCLPASYEPPQAQMAGTITEQLERGTARLGSAYHVKKFIAYFQSGSNTAGPVDLLARAYREALAYPGIAALSISTRPDCLHPDILAVLAELAAQHDVWVELGVQTAHDSSLTFLNRGHDNACSAHAINLLSQAGITHIVAHMILGLPGETEEMMRESFAFFSDCGAHGFKLHHLHVIKDTPLETMWREGRIPVYDLDSYARLAVDIVERIPADRVIHRLFGSAPEQYLCAPVWPGTKPEQLQRIRAEFKRRSSWQGKNEGRGTRDEGCES